VNRWRRLLGSILLALVLQDPPPAYTDFNLYNPAQQAFPSSVAGVTALGWSANVVAAYGCQDAAGNTLADFSGNGKTLTQTGTAAKTLAGQKAVGIFDGSSFIGRKAFETVDGSAAGDRFAMVNAAAFNPNWSTAFSMLLCVRFPVVRAPAASYAIAGNYTGAVGITIYMTSTGAPAVLIKDGSAHSVNLTLSNSLADGAWHWLYLRFDPVTDFVFIDSDVVTGQSASTAALVDTSSTAAWGLGSDVAGGNPSTPCQVGLAVIWSDIVTSVASIQSWWIHGAAPSGLTYTRASSFHARVADDATLGDLVAGSKSGAFAHEYDALHSTNTPKLGMASYPAYTQLLTETDLNVDTLWPVTASTKTKWDKDSPRGFRSGTKLAKTGTAVAFTSRAISGGITNGTVYCASIYYWWDGTVTAPTARVCIDGAESTIDATGLVDADTGGALRGDSKWHRAYLTFTAARTGAAEVHYYPSGVASTTGSCWFDSPMFEGGAAIPSPWVSTTGGTAATASVRASVTLSGLTSDYGTMKAWCVCRSASNAARYALQSTSTPGTLKDGHLVGWVSVQLQHSVWNAAPAQTSIAPDGNMSNVVETVIAAQWDVTKRNAWAIRIAGATTGTDATSLPTVAASPTVYLGCYNAGANIIGSISKARVWRYPEVNA
jgi:hypothetical protein